MSTSTLSVQRQRDSILVRARACVELTKPRIAVLVLITVAVAGMVASWGQPDLLVLVHSLVGTSLVAASGSALNQWLERDQDRLMRRTSMRPLPSGVLSEFQVVTFSVMTVVMGLAYLYVVCGSLTAGAAFASWLIYVWIYTPLKVHTTWNTTIGAVAGALPVWIGWFAAGGQCDLRSMGLFLMVFLWQFPHFMAIAWLYRRDYQRAGMVMLTVIDPTGRRAGLQAVSGALALIPVSFFPALYNLPAAFSYIVVALVLGGGLLVCALTFFARRDETSARWLLRASLIYLPALLFATLLIPLL